MAYALGLELAQLPQFVLAWGCRTSEHRQTQKSRRAKAEDSAVGQSAMTAPCKTGRLAVQRAIDTGTCLKRFIQRKDMPGQKIDIDAVCIQEFE